MPAYDSSAAGVAAAFDKNILARINPRARRPLRPRWFRHVSRDGTTRPRASRCTSKSTVRQDVAIDALESSRQLRGSARRSAPSRASSTICRASIGSSPTAAFGAGRPTTTRRIGSGSTSRGRSRRSTGSRPSAGGGRTSAPRYSLTIARKLSAENGLTRTGFVIVARSFFAGPDDASALMKTRRRAVSGLLTARAPRRCRPRSCLAFAGRRGPGRTAPTSRCGRAPASRHSRW